MVGFNVVERLRHQHDLSAYRRRLANDIGRDLLVRLLPGVLDLPLPLVGPDGARSSLDQALRASRRVALLGSSGAGRRLALQQLAMRWMADPHSREEAGDAGSRHPVLVGLPRIDDVASHPADLLARALESGPHHDGLGLFRRAEAEPRPEHGPLLIDGWEELSDERRTAWRAALLDRAGAAPTTQIAVALPPSETGWPSFAPLSLAPPAPELLAEWVGRLAPAEHHGAILAALAPGGSLAPLGQRLLEIALVAWLAPRAGLPRSRADLYDHALAEVLGVPVERLASAPALAELYGSIVQAGWSFQLAARARGLGSAWTTYHLDYEREVAELLGIPYDDVMQAGLIPVAYTIGTEFKPGLRRPLDTMVHWDHW